MDLKLLKMLCKDSKQHHVMFNELNSVSSLLCIAQNVRFEIPYKVLYFETPFLIIFKCYAWVSCGVTKQRSIENRYNGCVNNKGAIVLQQMMRQYGNERYVDIKLYKNNMTKYN